MPIWKKIKQSWNRFLARMAKSNKEAFGSKKLDCCNMNKPHSAGKQ